MDVRAGIRPLRDEMLAEMARVLDSGQFVGGETVAALEREFAAFAGATHAVAVRTGTDALLLALRALGIGPGDDVITAPNSFFATAEAIALAGARPVFADVLDDSLTLDPAALARRLTPRTKAIVPVHLYGNCADVPALRAAAGGLPVLEDACQAHGSTLGGVPAGALGELAAFSFYPTKNIGAIGEGGMVTTSSESFASSIRALRDHGQVRRHEHVSIGYNARLDALQCACLRVRLRHMDSAVAARRALAARYRDRLRGASGIRFVTDHPQAVTVPHLFVVRVADRDRVRERLAQRGVETAVHYPTPMHLQPALKHLGYAEGDFPVAENAAREILSLPFFPELPPEAVDRVVDALLESTRG